MSHEGNPGGTRNAPALLPAVPPVRLDPGVDTNPVWCLEHSASVAVFHFPVLTGGTHFDLPNPQGFTQPTLRATFEVIMTAGRVAEYACLQAEVTASGISDLPRAALNHWAAAMKS